MLISAGPARRDVEPAQPRRLRGILGTDRVVACDLDEGTVAQMVSYLGEVIVQVNRSITVGLHAAAARHLLASVSPACTTATCSDARAWLAESIPVDGATPLVSA